MIPGDIKKWIINVDEFYFGPVLGLNMTCDDCGDSKAI
jgi:hypothetical protein